MVLPVAVNSSLPGVHARVRDYIRMVQTRRRIDGPVIDLHETIGRLAHVA
jgi:hypothetical protein